MADETRTTIAIVASPAALSDVRAKLRAAGITTSKVEIAAMRVEREVLPDAKVPIVVSRRATLYGAAGGAALGLLLVAGWAGLIAPFPAMCGLLGGAGLGAILTAAASAALTAREVAPTRLRRDYWKIRVLGDATLVGRARGLASRTGQTLRRLTTDAFEVKAPRAR